MLWQKFNIFICGISYNFQEFSAVLGTGFVFLFA